MIDFQVSRDFGHPWTGERGWDGLSVRAGTATELAQFVAAAAGKFWKPWICGETEDGTPVAFLYKPAGASSDWDDPPR